MTQTRSRSAANMDNILEEITGKLFTIDDKIEKLADFLYKLEDHIQCFDKKLDTFIKDCTQNTGTDVNLTHYNNAVRINYKTNVDFTKITQKTNENMKVILLDLWQTETEYEMKKI